MVTFGVSLPTYCGGAYGQSYMTLKELREWVVVSENLGFTHFWHVDRLAGKAPPAYSSSWYEPIVVFSSIMPYLKKARIGTAVINITYRNPIILAKQVATLDRLSDGRLTLGLGQGWNKDELEACNVANKKRSEMFEETLTVLKKLLSEERVHHQGMYWKLNNFYLEPRPVQRPHPPLLIAGGGDGIHFEREVARDVVDERVFRRVARLGDGWIARTDTSPQHIKKYVKMLRSYLPEYGKSPEKFMIGHQNFVFVIGRSGSEEEAKQRFRKLVLRPYDQIVSRYVVGRPDEVESRIRQEVEAGIQHFIVMPVGVDYEILHFFAEEIMPRYHSD